MNEANDLILRPRFKKEWPYHNETVLKQFEKSKTTQKEYVVSRIDDHVFIRFQKSKQKFWTPELHLEINHKDDNHCIVNGLYGPSPTVWTFFMFLHFLVGTAFVIFGIWAYSNWSLNNDYHIQLIVAMLMVIFWFVLYAGGSIGKKTGEAEMQKLKIYMEATIKAI